MANKRQQERERLRQLREETEKRESAEQRRRLFVGYGIAAVLALAVIAGIVVLIGSSGSSGGGVGGSDAHVNISTGQTNGVPTDDRTGPDPPPVADGKLQKAAAEAGCVLKLNLPDEGHTHVEEGTKVNYKTTPPTSGSHVFPPAMQADGAYSGTPEPLDYVHSLEHGRMEIQYSSKLPESQQEDLKGLYDTLYGGSLLFPNDDMPYAVAATTWTNLIGCKTYEGAKTMDAIRDFGRETWNKYGAQSELDSFPIDGPTPAD